MNWIDANATPPDEDPANEGYSVLCLVLMYWPELDEERFGIGRLRFSLDMWDVESQPYLTDAVTHYIPIPRSPEPWRNA